MKPISDQEREEIYWRLRQEEREQVGALIEEYLRLLSLRFTIDPDRRGGPEFRDEEAIRDRRIEYLYSRLFRDDSEGEEQSFEIDSGPRTRTV